MAEDLVQTSIKKKRMSLGGTSRYIKKNWRVVLVLIALLGVLVLAYGYVHTRNQLSQLSNPKTAAKNETDRLVAEISRLAELPTGETPTLATVSDASKLKSQAFFAPAE
jgi:C4-dicarboxylate-specific signal transduction histidine kinase